MKQNTVTSATLDVAQPEKSSPITNGIVGLAAAIASFLVILWNLADEPYFVDESAMIAQSYYYTLFRTGQWQHPDWLHYAAYDHPPLPKYLFGLSLDLAGLPVPPTLERWMRWMGLQPAQGGGWEQSPGGCDFSAPDPRVLFWARVPSALFGAAGAAALFAIGLQLHSRLAGMLAAALLIANPLYLTHARRAMSDSFAECLVAASIAVALWGCRITWNRERHWWKWCLFIVIESVLCGLAALAKLNGGIATEIVVVMIITTWLLTLKRKTLEGSEFSAAKRLVSIKPVIGAAAIAVGSFLVFVALNPLMTARPTLGNSVPLQTRELSTMSLFGRAKFLVDFRRGWSDDALSNRNFQKDWLRTFSDRARMTVWEGFGRFSPLGPRDIRTHEPRPERERFTDYRRFASLVWLPAVLFGLLLTMRDGWRTLGAGRVPLAWALTLYVATTLAIVVFMIPLNWDRYYLPIQAPAAALVAIGIATVIHRAAKGRVHYS